MTDSSNKLSIEQLVRPDILELSAYHVPRSEGFLKLDAMENPYSWSPELKQEWLARISTAALNRYPDPQAMGIKQKLRKVLNISEQQEILLGNGSDEIIQLLAMALAKPGAVIMAPEPSFVMYKMIATFTQTQYISVPLKDDFELDIDAFLAAIETHNPALIFLAQPNNPTGKLISDSDIQAILKASKGLVVVDEAYMAFTDQNALPLLDTYDNCVVMRTFSKMGLAGLRLGFLVGAPACLAEIDKVRLPYNINILTQLSVEFALDQYDELLRQAQMIRAERSLLEERLASLSGVTVYSSEANFILMRVGEAKARTIFEALKDKKILIKCLDGSHPTLRDCLRITVGTAADSKQLVSELELIIADQ